MNRVLTVYLEGKADKKNIMIPTTQVVRKEKGESNSAQGAWTSLIEYDFFFCYWLKAYFILVEVPGLKKFSNSQFL